ncbi:MAG: hypothetical protein RL518_1169 [Pseudomonadota bacterium]
MSAAGTTSDSPWIFVAGESNKEVSNALAQRVADLRAAGKFSEDDERHIARLSFSVTRDGFVATPERVELLRRLCQIYSADVRPPAPTSHRRIIGPFIVFGKRMLQPVINAVFGPALRQQREFNANVVSLLTDLCNDGR